MRLLVSFCLLLVISQTVQHKFGETETITIKQGQLYGDTATTRGGRVYESFKGIPYGNIPGRFEVRK